MTVGTILAGKGHVVVTISGSATVREAVELLAEKRIGAMPVVHDDRVAGVFSEHAYSFLEKSSKAVFGGPPPGAGMRPNP